jgi:hypothetical protein
MSQLRRFRLAARANSRLSRRAPPRGLRLEPLEPRLALATDFTGPYALQHWTKTGIAEGTTSIAPSTGSSASAAFSYDVALAGGGISERSAAFTTVAQASGHVAFNYSYSGFHAFFKAFATFNVLNGATSMVAASGPVSGNFAFSGSFEFDVIGGQTFGFEVGGENFDAVSQLRGALTITNFSAPLLPDGDGDGVPDEQDNCRTFANADQADVDADGIGNACDNPVIVVNTADDIENALPGQMPLRQALNLANQQPGRDMISFALPAGSTISLDTGELLIADDLTIAGPGADRLTIDASASDPTPDANDGNGSRVFRIDNRIPLTKPGDPIVATSANSPDSERVANAIDNDVGTKYLNLFRLNTGFTVTPSVGATVVQGIMLNAANDAPERDPASYKLEGSNDGVNFSQISTGDVPVFHNRFASNSIYFSNETPYLVYRLTFPTVRGPGGNSMQIAEAELLGRLADAPFQTTDVEISGLTLTGGDVHDGGAIYNAQSLRVSNTIIRDNSAVADGGGICNLGTSWIASSTLRGNNAGDVGGGVANFGLMTITESVLDHNTAVIGGAIQSFVEPPDEVTTIINSTISANTALGRGGGINNDSGPMVIRNSTITGNTAQSREGGGIFSFPDDQTRTELFSDIVAGNFDQDLNFADGTDINSFVSLGNNLFGPNLYQVVPFSGTWDAANADALATGGDLAAITSAEENAAVFALVDQSQYWNGGSGPWIGGWQPSGSDEPAGGWLWTTGDRFTYSNWAPGEPNNSGDENRIQFFSTAGRAATWNDASSSALPVAYVREKKPLNYHPTDQITFHPMLGPLADNGGPTQTHAVTLGSPAVDGATTGVFAEAVQGDAPIAHYDFEDLAGSNARDRSANGRPAAYVNGPVFGQNNTLADGRNSLGRGVQLDGVNDYVRAPNGFANFSGGLTIEAWVYPTAADNWERILDFGNGEADNNIIFGRQFSSNSLFYETYNGGVSTGQIVAADAIELNVWQHFAITQLPSGAVTIYKNGVPLPTTGTTALPTNVNRTSNFIGRSNWAGDEFFTGQLSELAIYDKPLVAAQIAAHWRAAFAAGEVARYGAASQTSDVAPGTGAGNALDEDFTNFTHTAEGTVDPSWQVDLEGSSPIGRVVLYNRADSAQSRLRDITVDILDAAGQIVYSSPLLNPENQGYSFPAGPPTLTVDVEGQLGHGVNGHTVRVRRTSDADNSGASGQGGIPESNVLALAEVQVFLAAPKTDQRGAARPSTTAIDIGSFEICTAGDADGDGRVTRTDAALLGQNFGRTTVSCGQGDFDNNGRVDTRDLAIVQARLVAVMSPSPATSSAPGSLIASAPRHESAPQIATRRNHVSPSRVVAAATNGPRLIAVRRAKPVDNRSPGANSSADLAAIVDAVLSSPVESAPTRAHRAAASSTSHRQSLSVHRRD